MPSIGAKTGAHAYTSPQSCYYSPSYSKAQGALQSGLLRFSLKQHVSQSPPLSVRSYDSQQVSRQHVSFSHTVCSVATYMKEVMQLYHAYRYAGALCPASLLLQTHRCLVSTSCTAGAKVYAPSGHQRVTANPRTTEARPPSRLPPAAGATLRQGLCHTNRRLVRLHQPDPIRSTQPLLNAARRKYERQRSNAACAHVETRSERASKGAKPRPRPRGTRPPSGATVNQAKQVSSHPQRQGHPPHNRQTCSVRDCLPYLRCCSSAVPWVPMPRALLLPHPRDTRNKLCNTTDHRSAMSLGPSLTSQEIHMA